MLVLRTVQVPFSQDIIDRYKSPSNMLRHARWNKWTSGIALMKGVDLVGYVIWDNRDQEVKGLEVIDKYRGQGIGKKLLELAEDNDILSLTVNKDNVKAIKLYESCGWIPVKSQGQMVWMKKLK